MSIHVNQLLNHVIRPTLEYLNLGGDAAENLLLGTAAQESGMGTYIKQVGGPANGIYQMEPATQRDIWENFLSFRRDLHSKISAISVPGLLNASDNQVVWNLAYATAMCRVHYLRIPEKLPDAEDVEALAAYWKKYYNTPLGKGTEEEFVANYNKYQIEYYVSS